MCGLDGLSSPAVLGVPDDGAARRSRWWCRAAMSLFLGRARFALFCMPLIGRGSRLPLLPQTTYPRSRTCCQFGMIFVLPCRFLRLQKLQQLAATNLCSRRLHQKRAALSRSYDFIDLANKFLRQQNVGASDGCHTLHDTPRVGLRYVSSAVTCRG